MSQNEVIALVVVIISICIFAYTTMQEVFKFRLKKEQIKADAMVQAEAIKSKNQMDLELLLRSDMAEKKSSVKTSEVNSYQDELFNERRDRLNERL